LRHDRDLRNDATVFALPMRETEVSVIVARIRQAHAEQLSLCDELEEIADSLPAGVNRQKCIYAAKALSPLIRGVHQYEETVLFPQLERPNASALACSDAAIGSLADTLARLKYEHFEDEWYAEELTEALLRLGSGAPVNDEAVGYMLRGFFEGLRRHIAFEKSHLLQNYALQG
jgi:hemerythrin-like domain-containing protein